MSELKATDQGQIRAEIAALRARFEKRRNSKRPAAASLVAAYEAVLDQHYRRLDKLEKQ